MNSNSIKKNKYRIVMEQLLLLIDNGTYPPGSSLPSEKELMEKFSTSRITVRRAIDELAYSGHVIKHQGRNSTVSLSAKYQNLNTITSYTEEILRKGMTPSRKIIKSGLRLSTMEEQRLLNLEKAEAVFYMERVIYADQIPFCFTSTALPYKLFNNIELFNFKDYSLYDIMEQEYGIKVMSSSLKLKALSAKPPVSDYLNICENLPLLFSQAVSYGCLKGSQTEIPVEFFNSYYLTDIFEYTLYQRRK